MIRLLSGFILVFISISSFGQNRASELKKILVNSSSETILVASHRASHLQYPENSIPAIEDAIRLGVDIIEIDVKVSADGVPFLMHDRTINRTTTGKGDPEKMTWAELRKLFLVANGEPTKEKIPTLEEALNAARGKILVDLDMKTDVIKPVLEAVKKTKTEDFVVFFDGDREVLKQIQGYGSFMVMPRADDKASSEEVIKLFAPAVVHIDHDFNTPDVINLIKSNGARVWINALGAIDNIISEGNGIEILKPLVATGVNIIQTDQPQLLIGLLNQLGKRPDINPVISGATLSAPLIAAHRSKTRRFSVESTTTALKSAIQLGVDFIEIDVRTTQDGQMVNFHDGTINRTTKSKGKLKEFTFAQLREVKLKKAGSDKIPTLDEVAGILSEHNRQNSKEIRLYVDCKDAEPEALLNTLKKYDLHREAVFYGSDEYLLRLRSLYPNAKIMPSLRSLDELANKAAKLRPYAFDVNWKILDAETTRLIHGYHIRVFTDLLALQDRRKNYRKAKAIGIDVIQTDRAIKAKRSLGKK